MIKFWKQDIKYVRRTNRHGDFQYHFSVTGESSNYLLNKYGLEYSSMKLHVIDEDYITVTTEKENRLISDVAEIDAADFDELMVILQEYIEEDKRNWEEYYSDDWYKKDSRWV